MSLALNLWKEDLEMEKKKLSDIRAMTAETLEKIKRLEDEHTDQKIIHQKKLRNIRNIQSDQEIRSSKLTADIKLVTNLSSSRREELSTLIKTNAEQAAELKKTQEDTVTEVENLKKKIADLDVAVRQVYVDMQNEKELQVLLEVGLSHVKEGKRLPLNTLETILKKRQECMKKRQEEISKEVNEIEQEQAAIEIEIKQKQDKLVALKDTYLDLVCLYKKTNN